MLPRDDSSVVAFWRHVFEPNLRDRAIASLRADGREDSFRRATFDNCAIDACPHHGPSLAQDAAGQLPAVWFTLGPETWAFADEFEERVRFAIDRSWRGELPRTYLFDAKHRPEGRSGPADLNWIEPWLARQRAARPVGAR